MGEIHPNVEATFLEREPGARAWMKGLLGDFSISWADRIKRNNANIVAAILKPDPHLDTFLGLSGEEVLLVHSSYADLQRRVLQAAATLFREEPFRLRVAPLFYLLVSPASSLDAQVKAVVVANSEERTIVPLPEKALSAPERDPFLVRRELGTWLFHRNLFDAHGPLKTELFYFGRQQFTNELVALIQNGQSFGLFGLRKTGKTSLLFRLERMLGPQGCSFHFLDAQDPGTYKLRWWELIERLCSELSDGQPGAVTEKNASGALRSALAAHRKISKSQNVVLAVDEIEHIVPGLCSAPHWNEDFLHFWRTIRTVQSRETGFSVVVCGVNGSVLEMPTYGGQENPLYQFASARYMPPFERAEVREMVRTLARAMGIQMNEDVYDYLLQRYGGHTLLTRMACKVAADRVIAAGQMPASIARADLVADESVRDRQLRADVDNVLELLRRWYRPELEMLQLLAGGKGEAYRQRAETEWRAAQHLHAYGLVDAATPSIRVPLLSMFLESELSPPADSGAKIDLTWDVAIMPLEDLLAETGKYRNRLEVKLRKFVRRVLRTRHGDSWIRFVLECVPEEERKRLGGVDADKILNERLFLTTLIAVIEKNWANGFDVLGKAEKAHQVSKEAVAVLLRHVNAHREDAHAKALSAAESAAVRTAATTLEAAIDRYLDD